MAGSALPHSPHFGVTAGAAAALRGHGSFLEKVLCT